MIQQPSVPIEVEPLHTPSSPTRKPPWLRVSRPFEGYPVHGLLNRLNLNTICEQAHCPNIGECFGQRTATFLLMGKACTRNCRFCRVGSEKPEPLDSSEGERIAEAVRRLELDYVVLTSVTRDDLDDGGAAHLCEAMETIRAHCPGIRIELLIPDFQGDEEALEEIVACKPDVLGHNLETVPRLYPVVRPGADYQRSLQMLRKAKALDHTLTTKSALLLGLGEQEADVLSVMRDLRAAHCDLLVLGQYLQPSRAHLPVVEYVAPEQFDGLEQKALAMGFASALCRPLARSSYQAKEMFEAADHTKQQASAQGRSIGTGEQGNRALHLKECLVCTLGLSDYNEVWQFQRRLQAARIEGRIPDVLLLVEHPPVYTMGKSGDPAHLLLDVHDMKNKGMAFHRVDRGGDITFHGPGQLVGYLVIDLRAWNLSLRHFVWSVEEVLIQTLHTFGMHSGRRNGYPGVWVGEEKIASVGFEVRRWVTMHGFALNVCTDLSCFEGIVPCGLGGVQMTSMEQWIENKVGLDQVATQVIHHFKSIFDRAVRQLSPNELEGRLRSA